MHSIFKKGHPEAPVFVLLHGTGGDETSLLPIAQELNKQATVLSIRGDVSENGMNRYFKRLAEGHYDLEDLENAARRFISLFNKPLTSINFHWIKLFLLAIQMGPISLFNYCLLTPTATIKLSSIIPCFLLN